MDWKLEEDIICCEVCIYEYVIKKSNLDITTCINKIKEHASICNRDSGSIRNRIQNIKSCLENDFMLENTLNVSPLANVAKSTRKALIQCCQNAKLIPSQQE